MLLRKVVIKVTEYLVWRLVHHSYDTTIVIPDNDLQLSVTIHGGSISLISARAITNSILNIGRRNPTTTITRSSLPEIAGCHPFTCVFRIETTINYRPLLSGIVSLRIITIVTPHVVSLLVVFVY